MGVSPMGRTAVPAVLPGISTGKMPVPPRIGQAAL
jgi:hypothetical protein